MVGLGPDNFLSVCTSVRRKNLVQNGLSGRPFFIGSSRCGLSVQPDNPFATFFSIEMGYFSMGFLCNLRWRYHRRYPIKLGITKILNLLQGLCRKEHVWCYLMTILIVKSPEYEI